MKKTKIKKPNRGIIVAISTFCALNMCACNMAKSQTSKSEIANSSTETIDTSLSESTLDITSSTPETTKVEPTGFEALLDETIPCETKSVSPDLCFSVRSPGVGIGLDSPYLIEDIRSIYGNQNLTIDEVSYMQSKSLNLEGCNFKDYYDHPSDLFVDLEFVRYVLEENDLRLWTDEIPYSYFKEKYPEFIQYVDSNNEDALSEFHLSDYYFENFMDHNTGKLLPMTEIEVPTSDDELIYYKFTEFERLTDYNSARYFLASTYKDDKDGIVRIARSTDGKNVLLYTENQYKTFGRFVRKYDGCKKIDVLTPENREDLSASGIDVDKYDEIMSKTVGSAKMSDQNNIENTGKSKTR